MQIRWNACGCKSGACILWLNAVRYQTFFVPMSFDVHWQWGAMQATTVWCITRYNSRQGRRHWWLNAHTTYALHQNRHAKTFVTTFHHKGGQRFHYILGHKRKNVSLGSLTLLAFWNVAHHYGMRKKHRSYGEKANMKHKHALGIRTNEKWTNGYEHEPMYIAWENKCQRKWWCARKTMETLRYMIVSYLFREQGAE